MADDLTLVLALATAIGAALVSGIFFAFSNFIMAALSRLPAAEAIAAMQSINVTVLNRGFLALFFGTALAAAGLCLQVLLSPEISGSLPLVAGALVYIFGCVAVTGLRNVPLNQKLAAVEAASGEAAQRWQAYWRPWTRWNHLRTAAALAGSILILVGLA